MDTMDTKPEISGKKSWKMMLKDKKVMGGLVIAVVIILIALLYVFKACFVAATVNGSPISRWSIMKAAEKQVGAQILESKITEKLIKTELAKQKITVEQADIDAEVKKVEDQITAQGGTLDQALAQQGMSKDQFIDQIKVQKEVEKLLMDKVAVSEEDITKYIADNKLTAPAGMSADDMRKQIRDIIKQQKFSAAAQEWVAGLRTNSKVNTFVKF